MATSGDESERAELNEVCTEGLLSAVADWKQRHPITVDMMEGLEPERTMRDRATGMIREVLQDPEFQKEDLAIMACWFAMKATKKQLMAFHAWMEEGGGDDGD